MNENKLSGGRSDAVTIVGLEFVVLPLPFELLHVDLLSFRTDVVKIAGLHNSNYGNSWHHDEVISVAIESSRFDPTCDASSGQADVIGPLRTH